MTSPDLPTNDRAVCAAQTRLHGRVMWLSLLATLSVAAIVIGYLHGAVADRPAGGLAGRPGRRLRAARAGACRLQAGRRRCALGDPRWRHRYRLALGLQGLSWAAGALLLFEAREAWQVDLLVLALMGVAAGGLISTAFDRVAALLYAGPIALAVGVYVVGHDLPRSLPLVMVLLPIAALVMQRAHQSLMDRIELQLEQARHADAKCAAPSTCWTAPAPSPGWVAGNSTPAAGSCGCPRTLCAWWTCRQRRG